MTLEELLGEAERLARPCRYHRFANIGEPISGYWHGVRPGQPCISIERAGTWLNVFLDDENLAGRVDLSSEPITSGTPLFRTDSKSLPPIDALFRFGSPGVEKYLRDHGWEKDWMFNSNFEDASAHQYDREWKKQCPLYTGGVVAVEGGWNVPWPEDDWDDLVGRELVLWTFEDAEPWVEVFSDGNQFSVYQRIT